MIEMEEGVHLQDLDPMHSDLNSQAVMCCRVFSYTVRLARSEKR